MTKTSFPEDDLFKDSTMTFGEHLEELRGALFRSVAGALVGLLVAIFVAGDVVNWIEQPLRKGLREFYLNKARHDLLQENQSRTSLEDLAILEQLNWMPQVVRVSRSDIDRFLATEGIVREGAGSEFRFGDLSTSTARAVRSDLMRGAKRPDSAVGVAWKLLGAAGQTVLSRPPQGSSVERIVADLLNGLIEHADFAATAYPHLIDEISDPGVQRVVQQAYQRSLAEEDPTEQRLLNRHLLQLTFPDLERQPPEMVELVTWAPIDIQVQALSVHEPFLIYLKAALVVALLLSSPWIFYQIWCFVAAGLYPHERRTVFIFLPFSIVLFLGGASLAFFFVFQPVLKFLFEFNLSLNVDAQPRLTDWISFVLMLPLGFGVSFQLPLVMLVMQRIGIVTVESYLAYWRIAVLTIFIVSMFLTPADPISMILMAVPLTGLYFLGIALCKFFPSSGTRRSATPAS